MRLIHRTVLVSLLILLAAAASAEDVVAPGWRGVAGSTYQVWSFDTSSAAPAPEIVNNPYGLPQAQVTVGEFGVGWLYSLTGLGSQTGFWDLGSAGTMHFSVPNDSEEGCSEYVWIQVTCFKDISDSPSVGVGGGMKLYEDSTVVEHVGSGGDWVVERSVWRLSESVTPDTAAITSSVRWGSVIDEVIIDTAYVSGVGSVEELLARSDGELVEVAGPVVTRGFDGFFYIQDPYGVAAIRVNCPEDLVPEDGTVPWIVGTLRTIDGERVLDEATVVPGPTGAMPGSLGMSCTSLSVGLMPKGMLIRIWGQVMDSDPAAGTFSLQDGARQPVNVRVFGAAPPSPGTSLTVNGILRVSSSGTVLLVAGGTPYEYWP